MDGKTFWEQCIRNLTEDVMNFEDLELIEMGRLVTIELTNRET